MSTPYVRRPVLEGNTDIPVQAQPYLQGTVRKTSTGAIPGFGALVALDAAELVVEADYLGSGPQTVVFGIGHSDLLTEIITTINSYIHDYATASERDGCLRIQTLGVGETVLGIKAFIRVYPATNDYLGTGIPNDCASVLGFACYPDPAATVTAGDIESAATRPVEQGNLPGTRFIARGEDRTSTAFNRGLAQLALNADVTRTAAVREAYYPVSVELNSTNGTVQGWLRYDASGNVTQINLSALSDLFPALTGRLYVGDLSNESTLREIAKYWGVSDAEGRALAVYDEYYATTRTLRIGAVTRGEHGFDRMHFPDEDSPPASSIIDTRYVVADGKNVLGVSRLKQPTTAITEIRGKTNLVCGTLITPTTAPAANEDPILPNGFKTNGVAKGDVAVITLATVTSPFCHNGTYYVEDVISEQELILRPISDTDVESLNPNTGDFGSVTIYSSTEWSDEVWVALDPPLPRFPNNKLVLTFGIERETLNQREDIAGSHTDTSAVSDNGELTAFQSLQFWQRQSLGGAYAGMSTDRTADAGSIIKERTRSVTLVAPAKSVPSAGTYVRGPWQCTLLGDGVLATYDDAPPAHDDTFTLADVGRVVKLTGGTLLDAEPFLITEFIDGAHVRLAPLGSKPGAELPGTLTTVYDYEVYEDVMDYPSPLLTLIAPDETRSGAELSDVGVLYIREQNNDSVGGFHRHGRSLLHIERVASSALHTVTVTDVAHDGTTATVTVDVAVENFQSIFAVEGGTNRPVEPPYNGGSIFRIMNGPNAGFYLIQKTTVAGVLTLRTLDGDAITLDTGVLITQVGAFYNAHVSVGHKLAGTTFGDGAYRTAKLRVFFDSLEQDEAAGVGLSLDWRGLGAGISAQLNDADFVAYDSEEGAVGYLIDAQIYSPAHGINLSVTGADSGETARRSARGANIAVEGYQLEDTPENWGLFTGGETLSSWGAHIHQSGSDPALLVTKGVDVGAEFAHPTDAAIQVRLAPVSDPAARVYRAGGGALDVTGSIYLRHPLSNTPGGALYSETGVSAFQYLSSMVPPYFNNDRDGIYAFDGPDNATELGSADQVYPNLSITLEGIPMPPPAADFLPPDYTKFPFHHLGVVQVLNNGDFSDFLSPSATGAERHVGKVVEVSDSYAYGTVTVLSSVTVGKTLTIGGVSLEAVNSPGTDQFQAGTGAVATAASIVSAINGSPTLSLLVIASRPALSPVVTITALTAGSAGDTITLATDSALQLGLSGALVHPSANGEYTVIALKVAQAGDDAYIAVVKYAATAPWAAAQTGTFRMYGRRWHRAHLNIADFALIGTWDTTASRTDLPALTSIDTLVNDRQTTEITDDQYPVMGLQSYVPWSPAVEGVSLGFAGALSSPEMSNVYVTAGAYAAAAGWSGGAGSPVYSHGWAQDVSEPRSPFPNRALFTGGTDEGGYYSLDSAGATNSLAADDYTVQFTTGAASVAWSSDWGGSLYVNFGVAHSSVDVWQRGRTYVMTAHLSMRVLIRMARANGNAFGMGVSLRKADGTVVLQGVREGGPIFGIAVVPEDIEFLLTAEDLYKGASDVFAASAVPEVLYVVVTVSYTQPFSPTLGTANILEIRTEQLTRPAVVSGPQIVAGGQLAHSYRFTDPVRGFQTLGPADVSLLGGQDYARNESWPRPQRDLGNRPYSTGTEELRGTSGLFRLLDQAGADDRAANAALAGESAYINYAADALSALTAAIAAYTPTSFDTYVEAEALAYVAALAAMENNQTSIEGVVAVAQAAADAGTGLTLGGGFEAIEDAAHAWGGDVNDEIAALPSAATIVAGALVASDEAAALYLFDHPDGWVRPWVDTNRLFTKGVHGASVTFYTPAYDPLWYAWIGQRFAADPADPVDASTFVPPSMVGFLIPVDPPHGAVMTSLSLGLSLRAHSEDHWGLYHTLPSRFADIIAESPVGGAPTLAEASAKTVWDPQAGVRAELWRFNAIDFDTPADQRAAWTEHQPEFGLGEQIAEWTIDLSGVSPPSDTANLVEDVGAWATVYAGKEHFEKRTWALTGVADPEMLRVDRRHYTYMLVIRCYGGMRGDALAGTLYVPATRFQGEDSREQVWELPSAIEMGEGYTVYGHMDNAYVGSGTNTIWDDKDTFAPQVKFRGARLGWVTDRAGDGGW